MARIIKKGREKIGLPPGTLIHVGEKRVEKSKITIIDYNESDIEERVVHNVEDCFLYRDTASTTWINIDGIDDVELIEKIGNHFNLDYLVLEDLLNTNQRPKFEDHDDYLFIVLKMAYVEEPSEVQIIEQISIIIGDTYVISFQEKEGNVFNFVRNRLRTGKKRIRSSGPDYLAYALLDTIVDSYFVVLENTGEQLENLEAELLSEPTQETLEELHEFKRNNILFRKSAWPLREIMSSLEKSEGHLIKETTQRYLRDVYDHAIQAIDTIEIYRDLISGMFDMYLSSISNKMNEVMKVLTIIATIFIPMTFIAGLYGMNFQFMPELQWPWGYPIALLVMLGIGIGMLIFFKIKKFI